WRRRLPRVIPSADRREPLLPALDPGSRVLFLSFGGRDLCTPAAGEVDPGAALLELLCTRRHGGRRRREGGKRRHRVKLGVGIVAWSGGAAGGGGRAGAKDCSSPLPCAARREATRPSFAGGRRVQRREEQQRGRLPSPRP
ncbi:unnamed protein product, partial [Urochloa humidicola]